jgi:serine/threonine-protein kinase
MTELPQQIGKYEIVRRLGGGGMAEVFAARLVRAEGFARTVAIKRVLPGYAQDAAFASMFIQEAQLSARFNHPNVVSVLEFDRDPAHGLFLVMEMVEGRDLSDLMQTGLLPLPVVIHVIAEVLRGLGYAHNLPPDDSGVHGVIHRDVSPHNVLVSWEGAVKVSDFGIAKARGAATSASASVMIKGKPAYMSPEQANGAKLDGRSDLFAVGVMLWEMLVGRSLFAGGTMQEMFAALFFSQISPPHVERPDVPEDLSAIAMRLLARQREQRYATAEDAVSALIACAAAPKDGRNLLIEALAERFPGQAPARTSRAFAVTQRAPQPAAPVVAPPAALPIAPPRPARRRARLLGVFLGAVLGATALTLGASWLFSSSPPAPTAAASEAPTAARSLPIAAPPPPASPAEPATSSPPPEGPQHATSATAAATSPTAPAPLETSATPPPRRSSAKPPARATTRRTATRAPAESKPASTTKARVFTEAPNLLGTEEHQ